MRLIIDSTDSKLMIAVYHLLDKWKPENPDETVITIGETPEPEQETKEKPNAG